MSDETGAAPQPQGATQVTFAVRAQYIKDLSFENPGAVQAATGGEPPKVHISVTVNGREMREETHEVELKLEVRAEQGENVAFIAELTYAGMFHVSGVGAQQLRPLIMVECPRFLFPFARRIIADCTRDGGFPPLMLDPIDFAALFRRSESARQNANGGQGGQTLN